MLLLPALILLANQATVTFSAPADRLERLLPAIGKKMGLDLRASGALTNEVMLVSIKDRPADAVLQKIALTSDATWETKRGVLWLIRTPDAERTLRAKELARRTEAARASQEVLKKKLDSEPAFDVVQAAKLADRIENWYRVHDVERIGTLTNDQSNALWSSWEAIQDSLPAKAVAERMASGLDPSLFAGVSGTHRIVLSTRPTRMQRDLGAPGRSAIEEFVRMQNAWADVWRKRGEPMKTPALMNGDPRERRQTVNAGDLRAEVVIRPYADMSTNWEFRLLIVDQKGAYVAASVIVVGDVDRLPTSDWPASLPHEKPLKISEKSREAYAVFSRARLPEEARPPLSPQWKARLLDPVTTEPLSLYTSEDILEALRTLGKEMIGVVSDRAMPMAGMLRFRPTTTPSQFIKSVADSGDSDITEAGGLLIMKPRDPLGAENNRADRKDLAEFQRSVLDKGRVSIAGLIAFLAGNADTAYALIARTYANALVPGSIDGFDDPDYDMLRLYGRFTQAQRSALEQGRGLAWMDLDSKQQADVSDMVFWRIRRPDLESSTLESGFKSKGSNTFDDITDLIPNGLSAGTTIWLKELREPMIGTIARDSANRQYTSVHTMESLAVRAAIYDRAHGGTPEQYLAAIPGFILGSRRNLQFTFDLSPEVTMHRRLSETWFDSRKQVPFQDLPDRTRAAISAAIAAEMKKRQDFGIGGKGTPPPGFEP